MKQFRNFALAAVVAIFSATAFTSCKDGNEAKNEPNAPETTTNYNGEQVKTQFLINIAPNVAGNNGMMRMAAADVQEAGTLAQFRGMDSIVLVPFNNGNYATRYGKNIFLSAISGVQSGTPTAGTAAGQAILNQQNSAYYEDVNIPLGTNHFLFYAKAIDNTAETVISSDADMHRFGFVEAKSLREANQTADPAAIEFNLKEIYSTATTPAKATAIATYLTSIANAADATDNTKTWATEAGSNAALKALHDDFITLKAGSSFSVARTLTDLYNTLQRYQSTQVNADPAAAAVLTAIAAGATVTPDATSNGIPYTLALNSSYTGYPAEINLPDGAAQVAWNTNAFSPVIVGMGDFSMNSLNQYTYPASLQYFGQSAIKTSVDSKKDYYDGINPWNTILAAYENDDANVAQSTKSVALKDAINYAVGQFKVNVKHNATLKDAKNYDYTIPAEGIVWTGVLVGNQKAVDYKFEQKESAANTFVIYDNALNGASNGEVVLNNSSYMTNYTLVFSSKNNTAKGDQIYFALEFVNKGADFFGKNGLIPAGSKFYLVGELKVEGTPSNSPQQIAGTDTYNIFFKDYVTTANVTITSLANAYNVIPDLRSEGMELGFSVNLAWQPGLEFTVEL